MTQKYKDCATRRTIPARRNKNSEVARVAHPLPNGARMGIQGWVCVFYSARLEPFLSTWVGNTPLNHEHREDVMFEYGHRGTSDRTE